VRALKIGNNSNVQSLQPTWDFAILGQDVVIFIISNIAAIVRAGQTSVGICRLSYTFVFQSAAVPGGRNTNSRTLASPVRCKQPHFKTSYENNYHTHFDAFIFYFL
jgi:hypothetical protein